jgi:hypothetical protein
MGLIPRIPLEFLVIELAYLVVAVGLCILIFVKTREIYRLSEHMGLAYFRNAFLYFGAGFALRFLMLLFQIFRRSMGLRWMGPVNQLGFFLITYLSLMAIVSLTYSMIWKKFKKKFQPDNYIHLVAIGAASISFFADFQIVLLIIGIFLVMYSLIQFLHDRREKKSHKTLHAIYFLLFLFWIINLAGLSREIMPLLKIPIYLLSAVLFSFITYKVLQRLAVNGAKKK